jgi:hypothetical protein
MPMDQKKLIDFFTSGLGLLILGFVLTTVCGGLVNWMYARSTWKRDKEFELLKVDLAKHDELLTEFTKVIGARVFRLQRVVWLLDPPPGTPASETTWELKKDDDQKDDDQKLKKRWEKYYTTVADWNVNYRTYAIKIRVLAGEKMADDFIVRDVVSGARKAKAGTLCGVIEETHKTVADLKNQAFLTWRVDRAEHEKAQLQVDHLYDAVDDFVKHLYESLRANARSDELVSTRSGSGIR